MPDDDDTDLTPDEKSLLQQLGPQGFRFLPVGDDQGRPDMIQAVRTFPDGTADALSIHSQTSAQAVRTDPRGDVVWKVTDTVRVVLSAVLELPHPSDPMAPHLVLPGALPTGLWLPN